MNKNYNKILNSFNFLRNYFKKSNLNNYIFE